MVRPIAAQRCDFTLANTPLSGALPPQIIRLIEPQKARISLLTHKTTAVRRISGREAPGNQRRRWRSARAPRDEDQLTTGPVGRITQIVHDETGRHQGIGDLVAPPETQRRVRGQDRAVRLEDKDRPEGHQVTGRTFRR